ncbi:ATP-binding SpoIIE family protein phosphatase [Pedococcus sp.]|uniref:ATP-binding SpoIIE family protein phosphatase n=1 Tax=Pedococcus sp. TaxID=2860345 RepID=UPI002E102CDB|nr:SpoIIE family protein phosphatase [Pedococcus sp.]
MVHGRASEARRLADERDWSTTSLGPRDQWPSQLRDAWELALDCELPMALLCGDDFTMLYNAAFAELLGGKHPRAFGQPAPDVVVEVWDHPSVGQRFNAVLAAGEPFVEEGTALTLSRGWALEDEVDTGSYLRSGSPIRDENGKVVAVLHVVLETTAAIRRAQSIAQLATALAVAVTVDDVCKVVLRQSMTALDALSATICLPSPGPAGWRMARRHRIEELSPDEERLPLIWSETSDDIAALVADVTARGATYASENGEVVAVPLRAASPGAVLVVQRLPAPIPTDLSVMVDALVELVGEALRRAVLFDAERTTAELLQRTLLPPNLPQPDALSIAALYQPVSGGTVPGGDFYDSFFLTDGRLALVIGDVVGRGVMAATVMGQVRAAVRGAAMTDGAHRSVMATLDRVVWDLDALWPASMPLGTPRARPGMAFGGELFVTMLFGVVDPETGSVELASAGHPLPMLLYGHEGRAQGKPRGEPVAMTVGPPIGIKGERPVHRLELGVGDMLLAFTDGLLERRGEDLRRGEERLHEVVAQLPPGTPRSVAESVMRQLVDAQQQEDDCALLALGRSPEGHRRAAIVVPPMPESVKAARDWAREHLVLWDVAEGDQHTIVTGISELITNAVLHAGTESHLTLDLDSGLLAVTVADSGNRGEPRLTGADTMAVRGRGLSLVRAVADAFGTHRTSAGTTVWFEIAVELTSGGAYAAGAGRSSP